MRMFRFFSSVEVPFVFVLHPDTQHYYTLPASEISESFDQEQLEGFLQSILNGKAVVSKIYFRVHWSMTPKQ